MRCVMAVAGLIAPALLVGQASQVRMEADRDTALRLVISLKARTLWAIHGIDTLRTAPVAVPSNTTLRYGGRSWSFRLSPGRRTVVQKDSMPVWVPPEWHYYEVAKAERRAVARLGIGQHVPLTGGRTLEVLGNRVVVRDADGKFTELPVDEEIVFDGTVFIPPLGTANRMVEGELGRYRLGIGGGHSLHGTSHPESIGRAVTHGCIRMADDDIEWLYRSIPVGTSVYIY